MLFNMFPALAGYREAELKDGEFVFTLREPKEGLQRRPRIGATNLSARLAMGIMALACTARAISLRPTADACRCTMMNHHSSSRYHRRAPRGQREGRMPDLPAP